MLHLHLNLGSLKYITTITSNSNSIYNTPLQSRVGSPCHRPALLISESLRGFDAGQVPRQEDHAPPLIGVVSSLSQMYQALR